MALTAGTPLPILMDRLEKAEWGDLETPATRGLHRVLADLGKYLNGRSGAGKTTADQIGRRVGYTERWVRRCLELLEELDLIEWQRGGIVKGKPTPSWIRVDKSMLVDLIHIARTKQADRLADAAKTTRHRVAKLRSGYTKRPGPPATDHKVKAPTKRPKTMRNSLPASSNEVGSEVSGQPSGAAQGKNKKDDAAASTTTSARQVAEWIRADLAARRGVELGEKQQRRGRQRGARPALA